MTTHTLYLLVTCSMDKSREYLAGEVCKNLSAENTDFYFSKDLIVFDNASIFTSHFKLLPEGAKLIQSNRNIGYWSAINWILSNYKEVMGREYDYIYIIESDLIHYDLRRINLCEDFLLNNAEVGGVRTQDFSVKLKALYNKKYHWFPFVNKSSLVSQINPITGDAVWFELADGNAKIYLTNFHAKLPSLNRIQAMKKVFNKLETKANITELDFMRLYFEEYSVMAILDGGLYKMLSSIETTYVSGSYSSEEELGEIGYINTRVDQIVSTDFHVKKIN